MRMSEYSLPYSGTDEEVSDMTLTTSSSLGENLEGYY